MQVLNKNRCDKSNRRSPSADGDMQRVIRPRHNA